MYWPKEDVWEFMLLWRASEFKLTLTGNYLKDRQDFPYWWRDVYICNAIYQEEEEEVRERFEAADKLLQQMQTAEKQGSRR